MLKTLSLACLLSASSVMHADTLYLFHGPNFDKVSGSFTTADFIQGFVVLPTLAPNMEQFVQPVDFSFSDGIDTITKAEADKIPPTSTGSEPYGFLLYADSQGVVEDYQIYATNGPALIAFANDTYLRRLDQAINDTSEASFQGYHTPGDGSFVVASQTPEPSTFALLGTGALGMIAALRRRL